MALQAKVGGRTVAGTTVNRQSPAAVGVTEHRQQLARTGIYGDLFLPAHSNGAKPAVLAFGGSEGGLSGATEAALLAAHGYPALGLAYFGEPGLPRTLSTIPLEYFAKALKLLAAQPGVNPRRIFTLGASRGSEAALLLGAHYPGLVHGVIATSPSSVVNPAYPPTTPPSSAWTLGGKPLPAVPQEDRGDPMPLLQAPQAILPVEKIRGPILLICGASDREWPSCAYSEAITQRLADQRVRRATLLRYPDAGHDVDLAIPYLLYTMPPISAGTTTIPSGGTVLADHQADAQAWPQLLATLERR